MGCASKTCRCCDGYFENKLEGKINQVDFDSSYVGDITAEQLLEPCQGPRNEEGLRKIFVLRFITLNLGSAV